MELQPGAYFKVGDEGFEYVGTHATQDRLQVVGRLNPEEDSASGALHRLFDPEVLEEQGVKIGPFGQEYPYSSYVSERLFWEKNFPGSSETIPHPPKAMIEVLKRGKEQEIGKNLEAHFLPHISFSKENIVINGHTYDYPQEWILPRDWFFDNTKPTPPTNRGEAEIPPRIDPQALTITSGWRLIDTTPRPNYDNDKQMYPDDPLAPLLQKLTTDGVITPSVPGSRFGISWDQRQQLIDPVIQETLGLPQEATIRVLTEGEFNVIGNMFHPEFGQTSTYESLDDQFGSYYRLVSGDSDDGGLADIGYNWSGSRHGFIGFRPLIVFPSNP